MRPGVFCSGRTGSSAADMEPSMAIFCRIGNARWRRVIDQSASGVLVGGKELSFSEVWNVDLTKRMTFEDGEEHRKWYELLNPLPGMDIPCVGYALTYPGHRSEVELEKSICFNKEAVPMGIHEDIAYREFLDYEAEIGVLLHRGRKDRFGYLMVNDLTDRGIQVRTFDAGNMAPGFRLAKSFEGALRVGPLIVVGNEASWDTFLVRLSLNGTVRQRIHAKECLIRPGDLVDRHFDGKTESPWLLVATGTNDGVLFKRPNLWNKIRFFIGAGFSYEKAALNWLGHLRFLQPADEIRLYSPTLGQSSCRIRKGIDL